MLTKIACPSCSVSLKIAETLLGKTVKCPKCGASIPTASSHGAPARVASPRMEVSTAAEEDDYEDDELEQRRKSRKKSRKKKRAVASSNTGLLVGLVVGGLLIVGTGVTLGVIFWPKKEAEQLASSTQPERKTPSSAPRREEPSKRETPPAEQQPPATEEKPAGSGAVSVTWPNGGEPDKGGGGGPGFVGGGPSGGPGFVGGGPGGGAPAAGGPGAGGGRGALRPGGPGGGPGPDEMKRPPAGGGVAGPEGPAGPAGPMGEEPDAFAAGKRVFAQNCMRCHAIAGAGDAGAGVPGAAGGGAGLGPRGGGGAPGGMNRGPDLSNIGRDPAHNVAWFTKLIRNPKSVRANARMPAFDRLGQADIKALAEYLASLK